MSKNNRLRLVKEYIVKCRLDRHMGTSMEDVSISTYHTYFIASTSKAEAKQEARSRVEKDINHDGFYSIIIERCTEGS
ncbi:hypothetical protein DRO66_09405 [Candidatus Bathyarchaeota archaeon]|nr:MAG: hypothetical protein DRO66_09405 [Candidatus Bathyarchaeota archaeon]